MNVLESSLLVLSAIAFALVGFTYAGYPVVLVVCSRLFGRVPWQQTHTDDDLPTVTLLIAAHNEESEIADRLRNALAVDYPPEKFEVVIASDGSTDQTVEIARRFHDPRVRVLDFPERRGKIAVLNDVLAHHVRAEVVVMSDANTANDLDSVRRLAGWFRDPSVGVVCGRLVLTDPAGSQNVDSLYWKYETFLKRCESRLGALLGSNGGIYAIRRSAFTSAPGNVLVDDFVIPLLARSRTGCRIVYDGDAVAREETPSTLTAEFHRRARIGAGGFQSIGLLWRLLLPGHGWLAFTFLGHKVLRWLCPFFLLTALLSSAALTGLNTDYRWLLLAQVVGYALAVASAWVPRRPRCLRVLRLPALFVSVNAALFVGFIRWVRGPANGTWRRTARADAAPVLVPVTPDAGRAETIIETAALGLAETQFHPPLGGGSRVLPGIVLNDNR